MPTGEVIIHIDDSQNVEQCSICIEPILKNNTIILKCNHIFHDHCILSWLKEHYSCPICREHVYFLQPYHDDDIDEDYSQGDIVIFPTKPLVYSLMICYFVSWVYILFFG
jgi:hypothetical protein